MATLCLAGSLIACVKREILCDFLLPASPSEAGSKGNPVRRTDKLHCAVADMGTAWLLRNSTLLGFRLLSMIFWERMHGQVRCL
jgi:hypothetical protein